MNKRIRKKKLKELREWGTSVKEWQKNFTPFAEMKKFMQEIESLTHRIQ